MVRLRDDQDLGLGDTVSFAAKDQIPWRVLERTMDTFRFRRERDVYRDYCTFWEAPIRRANKGNEGNEVLVEQDLFPSVVMLIL